MIEEMNQKLAFHDLYKDVWTEHGIKTFMKYHVFCVWDFQSLAKKVQYVCSPPKFPWMPGVAPELRRLINEVILEEETDVDPTNGSYCSHYELYIKAMNKCGADLSLHNDYMKSLILDGDVFEANKLLPKPLRDFLDFGFKLIFEGEAHEICAVFAKGRETLIPAMFEGLISQLNDEMPGKWELFHYYLNRHIEIDGGEHGPASETLYKYFCKTNQHRVQAEKAVYEALSLRDSLWSFILSEINKSHQD